jgi:hypothetical protein
MEDIKKNLGAFYTPKHTVDYMISLLDRFGEKSNLLEPCGGDGIFVSQILDKNLLKPNQITVWDINPEVESKIKNFGVKIQIKDTLLKTDFKDNTLFGEKQEFSHIIGNPPYLNKQSAYIKKNKKILKKIYQEIGANDTYAMFLYLCGKLLKPEGQLTFITSDTYLSLGIHKKLRKWLLDNFTIKEITLCPLSLFSELGASVNTSIITIIRKKPKENYFIKFNDCRDKEIGNYDGKIYKVKQKDLLNYPDFVFYYKNGKDLIQKITNADKLINYLDGGLGMHTTNNGEFLGMIDYADKNNEINNVKKIQTTVPLTEIKNGKWKVYHKRGGNDKYYSRPKYCIKWDDKSIRYYKIPKDINFNETRQGFIVSGVCSELSARLAMKNALWESNKAMCFFPKEPEKYPATFFIGLLNSEFYNKVLKFFNHTNSIQVRDIKKLPFYKFENNDVKKISDIAGSVIENKKTNQKYNFEKEQKKIDLILKKYLI